MSSLSSRNSNGVLLVAAVGLFIAIGTFLAIMINSSRAKTPNRYSNLIIPIPSIPTRPSVVPIARPSPQISPILEPSLSPTPITSPSATPIQP